jgi:hypothetical protein
MMTTNTYAIRLIDGFYEVYDVATDIVVCRLTRKRDAIAECDYRNSK